LRCQRIGATDEEKKIISERIKYEIITYNKYEVTSRFLVSKKSIAVVVVELGRHRTTIIRKT